MSEFNGLVLYKPTEDDLQYLKNIVFHVSTNKPNIKGIINKYRVKHWWKDKFDWDSIIKEADKYAGWEWDAGESPYSKEGYYAYSAQRAWVIHIKDILSMLSINKECYITPNQSTSLGVALSYGDLMLKQQALNKGRVYTEENYE